MRKLKVTAVKGYTTIKLDFLSENDPFIMFTKQGQDVQYTTSRQNQDMPIWNETFQFNQHPYNNILKLTVFDKDQLISQSIGSGQIDLGPYFRSNQAASVYVRISHENVPAGKILLQITPENSLSPTTRILSNEDINYYQASKHHKYISDFQKQGNLLGQLIQKQLNFIQKSNLGHMDRNISSPDIAQNKIYANQKISNNMNYKLTSIQSDPKRRQHTNPSHINTTNYINYPISQIPAQSNLKNLSVRPSTKYIQERYTNYNQIPTHLSYPQANSQNYQYPLSEVKTPIKIVYSQPNQPQNTIQYQLPKGYTSVQNGRIKTDPGHQIMHSKTSGNSHYNFLSPPPSYLTM